MRVLIVQLSDAHAHRDSDKFLRHGARLVEAIRTVESSVDLCIIACSGDLAFSGLPEEYELVTGWLEPIVAGLASAYEPAASVVVAAIPGNHDCDFTKASPVRQAVLDAVRRDPASLGDSSAVGPATSVQDAFFAWRDVFAGAGLLPNATRLYYEYLFFAADSDNGSVRVRCLNTAWLSERPEPIGTHVFPPQLIPELEFGDELVVTMMHHPANWFAPMNARELRARLQKTPGIIFTGHEHEFSAFNVRDNDGGGALRIEGAVLQEHGTDDEGFNVVVVDTDARLFRLATLQWKDRYYIAESGAFGDWTPLATEVIRAGGEFLLSSEMREYLRDAGVDLYHPTRGLLHLEDIFVYPDLREYDEAEGPRSNQSARGEAILEVSGARERVLITGAREIGKTSFSKRLFVDAIDAGLVPILLRAKHDRLHGDHRDERTFLRTFEDQYTARGEDLLAVPRDRRVIIIDDFDSIPAAFNEDVLAACSQFAGRVIAFAHDLAQQIQQLVGLSRARKRLAVARYGILPCGYRRREQLIDKYVRLAAAHDPQRAETLRAEMRSLLETALGSYYAPPLPISIVSLLQARAFNDQLNLSQSTYGYYYELLIRRSLAEAAISEEYDVSLGYLTALVGRLYSNGRQSWDQSWFMRFHGEFNQTQALNLRFTDVESALLERNIIGVRDGLYSFRYGYFYYFFAARFLTEGLTGAVGKEEVRRLTRSLAQEEPANILLFLTHLSKDAAIIDPMLEQADRVFASSPRCTLADTNALGDLGEYVREAVYDDRPVSESREHFLAALDDETASDDAQRAQRSIEVAETASLLGDIYEAFRTMQILGQLVRNFPGTLTGDQKRRITSAVYGVGLRTLGRLQELFQNSGDDAAAAIVATMRDKHPEFTERQLFERTLDILHWYFFVASAGITHRVAVSVGHPLLEPIYAGIEKLDPVPAVKLIGLAIKLERHGFPQQIVEGLGKEFHKNPLATRLLHSLVLTHFHMFDVDRTVKQQTCDKLGIKMRPPAPRLLSATRLIDSK